jgi:hypothetical protein
MLVLVFTTLAKRHIGVILMFVFMRMGVRVRMGVHSFAMTVLMGMGMRVLMGVFRLFDHDGLLGTA